MKMFMFATALSLCLASGSTSGLFGIPQNAEDDAAKPCCSPEQWEGKAISSYEAYHRPELRKIMEYMPRISMDFTNGRFAVDATVVQDRRSIHVKAIADYKSSTAYIILPEKRECFKRRISGSMKDGHCIPASAKHAANWKLGLAKDGLPVDVWIVDTDQAERDMRLKYNADDTVPSAGRRSFAMTGSIVTRKGCIPVQSFTVARDRRDLRESHAQYHDITEGIASPSVFTPPSYCNGVGYDQHAQEDEIPTPEVVSFLEERFDY